MYTPLHSNSCLPDKCLSLKAHCVHKSICGEFHDEEKVLSPLKLTFLTASRVSYYTLFYNFNSNTHTCSLIDGM